MLLFDQYSGDYYCFSLKGLIFCNDMDVVEVSEMTLLGSFDYESNLMHDLTVVSNLSSLDFIF